ncbi:MAG: hypothetical protein R3Y07_08745 [Eubacteriales bacterium]
MKKTTIIASTLLLLTILGVYLVGPRYRRYDQAKAEAYAFGAISSHYNQETSEEYQKIVDDGSINIPPTPALPIMLLRDALLPESEKAQYMDYLEPGSTTEERDKLFEELDQYEFSDQVHDLALKLVYQLYPHLKFSVTGGEKLTGLTKSENFQFSGYQGVVHFEIHPLDFLHDLNRETLDQLWETHTAEQGVSPETRNSYLVEVLQTLLDSPPPPYLPPISAELPVVFSIDSNAYFLQEIFPSYQDYDFSYHITNLVFAFDGN